MSSLGVQGSPWVHSSTGADTCCYVLGNTCAPVVVPQASDLVLPLENGDFRNFYTLVLEFLKGGELEESVRTSADNGESRHLRSFFWSTYTLVSK